MKKLSLVFLIFLFTSASAQDRDSAEDAREAAIPHIYHVNGWVTAPIIVVGSVGSFFAYYTGLAKKPTITDAEFNGLDRRVFGIDSWALDQPVPANRNALITQSYILQFAIGLAPITLFIDERIGHDWGRIFAMLLEVNAVSVSLYTMSPLGPLFQDKYRPYVYYDNLPRTERNSGYNRNSFYSGHVAAAAAATFFMGKVYTDYYPNANKFLVYAGATLPPLVVGYMRFKALEHFPSDILVGLSMGALCGVLIPELHKIDSKDLSVGFYSSPTSGTGIAMQAVLK